MKNMSFLNRIYKKNFGNWLSANNILWSKKPEITIYTIGIKNISH